MAALDDLISQIPDESLRERIQAEVKRANRQKKFGLVFEEHLPEATPLYDIPVKRGSVVAKKDGQVTDIYYVEKIEDGQATCFHKASKERVVLPVDALVCVAQFGEPIYPYLQPLDTVCNAPDSDLWHISLAVAVTIRMPLSLIPSSSASSCRRPVDFSALLFGKKN